MPPPKERGVDSLHQRLEVWFNGLEQRYTTVLEWSLANRGKTTLVAIASIVLAILAGSRLDGEFMPKSDSGFLSIEFRTPPGTSLEATTEILQQNENWVLAQPEVASTFAAVGPTSMSIGGPSDGMRSRGPGGDSQNLTTEEEAVRTC